MATYLEVADPAAGRAAAKALSGAGEQLAAHERCMPEVDWGGDKFGNAMQANYPTTVVADLAQAKEDLAELLTELGATAGAAITAYEEQDNADASSFSSV